MSLFFCLCVFCDSFLCYISLLLLSGSLSYILNSVLRINVIVHANAAQRAYGDACLLAS